MPLRGGQLGSGLRQAVGDLLGGKDDEVQRPERPWGCRSVGQAVAALSWALALLFQSMCLAEPSGAHPA